MKVLAPFAVALLLAGCADSPANPDSLAADIEPIRSDWWQATTNLEGRGAVRLQMLLPEAMTCTILMAAHHGTGSSDETRPWFELRVDGETIYNSGGPATAVYEIGVEQGPVDTVAATKQAWNTVFGTYAQAIAGASTFTSWLGLPDWPVGPGVADVFVMMDAGLVPDGDGETDGASALVRASCDEPVQARAQVDPEARVVDARMFRGGSYVETVFGPSLHQGTQDVTTIGPKTELEFTTRNVDGHIGVSGAFEDKITFASDPANPLGGGAEFHRLEGPSGNLTLAWDFQGLALSYGGGALWSWEPSEPVIVEPSAWPWD